MYKVIVTTLAKFLPFGSKMSKFPLEDASENLFSDLNIEILNQSLIGRTALSFHRGDITTGPPADVYIVQSIISGARGISAKSGKLSGDYHE